MNENINKLRFELIELHRRIHDELATHEFVPSTLVACLGDFDSVSTKLRYLLGAFSATNAHNRRQQENMSLQAKFIDESEK